MPRKSGAGAFDGNRTRKRRKRVGNQKQSRKDKRR